MVITYKTESSLINSSKSSKKHHFSANDLTSQFTLSSTPNFETGGLKEIQKLNRTRPESILLMNANKHKSQSFNDDTINSELCSISEITSEIEKLILRARDPIELENLDEEIEVDGQRGLWANKEESKEWKGQIPLNQYKINKDTNPLVLTKVSSQKIEYNQNCAIRYLKPTTPPPAGEIYIKQMPNEISLPAPPIILRQQPPRTFTPEPLIMREKPTNPPKKVDRKVITISGKKLPPPPRKVVIERLSKLPNKPQSVILERWMPYLQPKRKVVYKKTTNQDPVLIPPKNVIVQWELPEIKIRKELKYLGVIKANPSDYVKRYKDTITETKDLPKIVSDIPTPIGLTLAADYKPKKYHELEGDLNALGLIDLDREGLSEYKNMNNKINNSESVNNMSHTAKINSDYLPKYQNKNFLFSPNRTFIKNINELDSNTEKLISSCNKTQNSSSSPLTSDFIHSSTTNTKKYTYSIYDIRKNLQQEDEKNQKLYYSDDRSSQPLTTSHFTGANISQSVSSDGNNSSSNNESIYKIYSTSYNNHNNSMINFYRQTNPTKSLTPNKKIRSCIPRLTQSCNLVSESIANKQGCFLTPNGETISSSLESRPSSSVLVTSSVFNNEFNMSHDKSIDLNNSIETEQSKFLKSIVTNNDYFNE